ncbi:RNA-guided endonuclease InsQ/TnpB family protein [Merismopedia glauca]|uniref:Transposase n=1 Tax=Merismopedia glauca CCAP 1448/3 TaxID=1296344 RepID=A0A2T1C0E0_9CYAN|nr:RNA-guided endonuclease TnpB family protein [Merismopedia glauca]PSB01736.1 transposase [Merismopedia glauca CCAP 1448/3]
MQLVQRHIINKNHKYWSYFDQQAFLSKNLFNLTNYQMRQHFFEKKEILSFTSLYHLVSKSDAYYALPNTKVAKQIIRRIHKAWIGYKQAHKDWKRNPSKYLGEPRIPKYKDKIKGRYAVIFPDETVSKPALRKGVVKLTPCPIEFESGLQEVDEVRVIPRSGCYVVEIVYSQEPINNSATEVAGIDLGLTNLITLTSNQPGVKPLLIKGGALKAINTYYNKQKAKIQSELENKHKAKTSNRLNKLTHKRNCRVNNYLHTSSRRVIDWCIANQVGTLIVGKNDGWKQSINIGRKNNQQFVNVPHAQLISMISYKAELLGIKVVVTEESYSSKSSILDNDPLPKYGEDKPKFSGKRVKRGLYVSKNGIRINADVQGSLNIIRKVKPNVFDYGLRGLPFSPVTLDPLRTHDFLQIA